jgi:hypothetical protein
MTYRIRIEQDARVDGIAVQIAERLADGAVIRQVRYERTDAVVVPEASMPAPSLVLSDDLGRALLDALAAHYGGTTGGRQQRADFEHERARVDRLIGHLTREATS